MKGFNYYKPSLTNPRKYSRYFQYLIEYLKCRDIKSLGASFKYLLAHKLPAKNYKTSSKLGQFHVRKNTTDFQVINYAYEKAVKDYLISNIDNFDVFIDVGAYIGEYTVWLARMGKRCIALEPVSYEALRANVTLNSCGDKIQTFNYAAGSKEERVYFQELPNSSYMVRKADKAPNVVIKRLDDLTNHFNISHNDRIIMKLDVEGMEDEVVEGAKQFIKSTKNLRIIFEHFKEDNFRNDKVLLAIGNFRFETIDEVNRIAIKN